MACHTHSTSTRNINKWTTHASLLVPNMLERSSENMKINWRKETRSTLLIHYGLCHLETHYSRCQLVFVNKLLEILPTWTHYANWVVVWKANWVVICYCWSQSNFRLTFLQIMEARAVQISSLSKNVFSSVKIIRCTDPCDIHQY